MPRTHRTIPYLDNQATLRFWDSVHREDRLSCWGWGGYISKKGRAVFNLNDKSFFASRVMWTLVHGAIPSRLLVCHSCDNPRCVNPDHLFLGTDLDNAKDRDRKGRGAVGDRHWSVLHPELRPKGSRNGSIKQPGRLPRGEKHGNAKLTAELVINMRKRFSGGQASMLQMARESGLSFRAVWQAVRGITWKHIDFADTGRCWRKDKPN